jgi:hypothetical protein
MVEKQMVTRQFTLPSSRTDLISLVCRAGRVLSDRTQDDKRRILVKGSRAALGRARKLVDEGLGVRRAGS